MTNIMVKESKIFTLKNESVDFTHLFYKLNVFKLSKKTWNHKQMDGAH